jgi:hypothetical protein
MASEALKEQEQALKEMMIYQCRAGMWEDWLGFQKQMKDSREAQTKAERAKKAARKKRMQDTVLGITLALLILSGVGLIAYLFYWMATK